MGSLLIVSSCPSGTLRARSRSACRRLRNAEVNGAGNMILVAEPYSAPYRGLSSVKTNEL